MIFKFLERFLFTDVTPLMKQFQKRQVDEKDFFSIDFINETLSKQNELTFNKDENEKSEKKYLQEYRKSPFHFVLRKEKKLFYSMFWIHMTDVLLSVASVFLSIQILRSFEPQKTGIHFINYFFQHPNSNEKIFFSVFLAFIIFLMNIFAASLHAQKIEKEMLIAWKIPFQIMRSMYIHLLKISKKDRSLFPSGEITNMAQNDSSHMGDFFAHCLVDFPVLLTSCAVVMFAMIQMIGPIAWIGLFILLLQIPISLFSSWLGNILHAEVMRRSDKRIDLITEWIQGVRLVRYLGWNRYFKNQIQKAANSEFIQDIKLSAKYSFAFAITVNWWMMVCSGIFGGLLYFKHVYDPSIIFGTIWLTGILGLQITPLPWFVAEWSQSIIASRRLKNFFQTKTQEEEFPKINLNLNSNDLNFINEILHHKKKDVNISFELKNVSLQFSKDEPCVLKDISLQIPANQTLAIVGTVASGKSLLIQILMGDLVPSKGEVLLFIEDQKNKHIVTLPVHNILAVEVLRCLQSYVPQESFIVSATISENVPLDYFNNKNDNLKKDEITNALYQVSLGFDIDQFSHKEKTIIGERGVNLSGGQKQRLNLSRSAFLSSQVIFLDDPLSAVDKNTEKDLVQKIFFEKWGFQKTILWATHRLEFLNSAHQIICMDKGEIIEHGKYEDLISKSDSHLNLFIQTQKQKGSDHE